MKSLYFGNHVRKDEPWHHPEEQSFPQGKLKWQCYILETMLEKMSHDIIQRNNSSPKVNWNEKPIFWKPLEKMSHVNWTEKPIFWKFLRPFSLKYVKKLKDWAKLNWKAYVLEISETIFFKIRKNGAKNSRFSIGSKKSKK